MSDEAKQELVQKWFLRAQHDLETAKILFDRAVPMLDTAIYHCQQAGEKAVKGYLVLHDTRFEKIHIIPALVKLAIPHEPKFEEWLKTAELLTPYAIKYRYGDTIMEPSKKEVETAIKAADDLYNFVLSLVPPETHPQTPKTDME